MVPPRAPRRRRGGSLGCGGCLGSVLLVLVILMLFSAVLGSCGSSGTSHVSTSEIQTSSIHRERLNSPSLVSVGWYTDNLDWIRDADTLEKGLAYFYKRTGVSPYLYLTEDIDGAVSPTSSQLDTFAQNLYDELFLDEAHILVVFQEYGDEHHAWYVCGLEARAVMDDEACEILLDCLDAYYYSDYGDEEYFSKAFTDAADRIMDTKVPASVYVVGVAVVLGIGVLAWLIYRKATGYKEPPSQDSSTGDATETILETADAQTRFRDSEE